MRWSVVSLLALAAGCSGDSVFYLASTQGDINGVVMRSMPGLERDAQVGMNEVTCLLGIGTGQINTEWDYPTSRERVEAVGWQQGEEVVAVMSDDQVHLQRNPNTRSAEHDTVAVPGVRQVRIYPEGFVALTETEANGCAVSFHGDNRVDVPLESCDGVTLAAGPGDDWTYVGADGGLSLVSPNGDLELLMNDGAGLVVWDDLSEALYVADPGDSVLRVIEPDGLTRYTVDVGHPITSIDAQQAVGRAVVSVSDAQAGGIFVIDGGTGEIVASQYTPVSAKDVSASLDGRAFALTTDEAVHFYAVGDYWEASAAAWETYQENRPRQQND